jgi:hypothetical protein
MRLVVGRADRRGDHRAAGGEAALGQQALPDLDELADQEQAAVPGGVVDDRGDGITGVLQCLREDLVPAVGKVVVDRAPWRAATGQLLLRNAEVALNALDGEPTDPDRAFYRGKVAAATFFAKNVLPRLTAERKIIEAVDLTVMDLREESF